MMADVLKRWPIKAPLTWTTVALVSGMLLHVDRVPFWVTAAALVCVAWRLAGELRLVRVPGRVARVTVALLLMLAVILRFKTVSGLSAGTALLVIMGAIKLLETHTRRDRFVVIGTTMFLLLAACLDRQGLLRAPLYLLVAWLCCIALATVAQEGTSLTTRTAAILAARTLALSAPLALMMFLFFPRMVGGFWVLPESGAAVTGLSDTMTPGGISELSESDDPAFRVRFLGATPPPEERYWRGPVLHEFDGYTWSRGNANYRQPQLEPRGELYRYRVTLEPSSQRWWFALDTISEHSTRRAARITFDHQLVGYQAVTRPMTYEAASYTRTVSTSAASPGLRHYDLRLPAGRNLRSARLAREMRASAASDEDYMRSVLAFFRGGGFVYTLTPPLLSRDSVDDFLFDTRRGFCGHYASAYVTMMRAAGLPARVVTGYHGGEWNRIREYFVVRQSDAHAWAEVWLDGRGWTRVDPTAVIAPDRLRRGLYDLLPNAMSASTRALRDIAWLYEARQRWDAINDWWNERVVRFDLRSQIDLLKWMGISEPDWRDLGWLFAAALVGWLLFVAWHVGRALRATPMDRLARAYTRLCAKLAKAGAPRAPHEGPLAYADVVAVRRPDIQAAVRSLLRKYAELRFGETRDVTARAPEIAAFERDVARLSVPRAAPTS